MAILAAGVGFGVRGGILANWGAEYGFTNTELGDITGMGLVGFGVVILLSSFIADSFGYGKLMITAFVMHLLSAVLTLSASIAFKSGGKEAAYFCLYWGQFLFSVGNGVSEAVVNPLTATLFPNNKTHYLNILHAGWPAGLILGGLIGIYMGHQAWQVQMGMFLIPVVIYGVMLLGQRFPKSEASTAGISMGQMLGQLFMPLMLLLLFIHALVGYVELGTDSWIQKITGGILDTQTGKWLFVYTSGLMFLLRFVAGPIVHKISPLGLLFVSAVFAATGLYSLSGVTATAMALVALTIYGIGKTFFWPTMLAVVSERFPKGGAITMGAMGAVGMLSAGYLGGPGIGYKQDFYASNDLKAKAPAVYDNYAATDSKGFLFLPKIKGLDQAKVETLEKDGKNVAADLEALKKSGKTDENVNKMNTWWQTAQATAATDKPAVAAAGIFGSRMALKFTAVVPAIMAVLYLLLILGFKARGGYKALHVADQH
ncbi:MAG: MFS transporter [Verrucomicrobiaceae bacterium]